MPKRPPVEYPFGEPDQPGLLARFFDWLFGWDQSPITYQVKRLPIEDGDIVVISTNRLLTAEQMYQVHDHTERLMEQARRKAPVLVLNRGFEIRVLKTSQLPLNEKGGSGYTRSGYPIPPPPDTALQA